MNASFPQTSGLRQELSRPRQQGGLSVDPGQEGGHPWALGCGCGKDDRGCWGDLNATRTVGPGVSWGKGQVRKCPRGQRRPGVAGLAERDSFGRREPLPLRGPRVCRAEMLRPASGSERSLSQGSPLTAAGLAAPSKRPVGGRPGVSILLGILLAWGRPRGSSVLTAVRQFMDHTWAAGLETNCPADTSVFSTVFHQTVV